MPGLLLLTDDPTLVALVRQKLRRPVRRGDIDLAWTEDASEAWRHAEANEGPEVVVVDADKAGVDASAFCAGLDRLQRGLLAVVVSADREVEAYRAAMRNGVFDYLTKPLDLSDFESTLQAAFDRVQGARETSAAPAAGPDGLYTPPRQPSA
jgi:adenylate cyclase